MARLIDTSVLVALERRGQWLTDLPLLTSDEPAAISAITASELLVGAHRADSTRRRDQRLAFAEAAFSEVPVFPFDLSVARVHAELAADLLSKGPLIGVHDLIIAATPLAHGYAVLTANPRDFNRVPDLEVRQPDW